MPRSCAKRGAPLVSCTVRAGARHGRGLIPVLVRTFGQRDSRKGAERSARAEGRPPVDGALPGGERSPESEGVAGRRMSGGSWGGDCPGLSERSDKRRAPDVRRNTETSSRITCGRGPAVELAGAVRPQFSLDPLVSTGRSSRGVSGVRAALPRGLCAQRGCSAQRQGGYSLPPLHPSRSPQPGHELGPKRLKATTQQGRGLQCW